MKFSCERCGKKYATADAPAPGRVYKIRCKACGHLMVVRAPASTPEASPGSASGYVDLFADGPPQEHEKPAEKRQEPPPESSLPAAPHTPSEGHGAAEGAAAGSTTPRVPVIPKPPQQSNALPWILIISGAIVLLGILAFVLLRGSR